MKTENNLPHFGLKSKELLGLIFSQKLLKHLMPYRHILLNWRMLLTAKGAEVFELSYQLLVVNLPSNLLQHYRTS